MPNSLYHAPISHDPDTNERIANQIDLFEEGCLSETAQAALALTIAKGYWEARMPTRGHRSTLERLQDNRNVASAALWFHQAEILAGKIPSQDPQRGEVLGALGNLREQINTQAKPSTKEQLGQKDLATALRRRHESFFSALYASHMRGHLKDGSLKLNRPDPALAISASC